MAPAEPGKRPPGHLWRWELEPLDDGRTRVTHTYDWTRLTDPNRLPRARATTRERAGSLPRPPRRPGGIHPSRAVDGHRGRQGRFVAMPAIWVFAGRKGPRHPGVGDRGGARTRPPRSPGAGPARSEQPSKNQPHGPRTATLQAPQRGVLGRRATCFDEGVAPAGPQDAAHLGDHGGGIGHRAQHEAGDHRVHGRVGQVELFGDGRVQFELDPARAARARSRACIAGFGSTAISRVPGGR